VTALTVRPRELRASQFYWTSGAEVDHELETAECTSNGDGELPKPLRACEWNETGALFERYSRLVLAIASRVLGDASEAEEVLQEVFLYLYRKPELFDPHKGTLKSWIIQVTLCRALDRKSYLARRRWRAADLDTLDVAQRIDIDTQIEARLSRRHLERALADLSHMQRRTIEFFYFEGLDLREISQQLRQPLGNVRHHFYRGLKRLRNSAVLHSLRCK
jgi:RNA polymerase sigma-70 factor (ECF subfamily)